VTADDDRNAEPTADDAPSAEPMHPAVRWLARLAVVAIGLRFVVQGFREQWSGADEAATVFLYLAVLLGVCSGGLALVELARRRRG
jgi:hypothetical protein